MGMEMITNHEDHFITAYRCHAAQYTRDTQVAGMSSLDSLKVSPHLALDRSHPLSRTCHSWGERLKVGSPPSLTHPPL